MGKQQEELGLNSDRRTQLDNNIKKMIEGGASNEDVIAYASEFKSTYGVKKKEPTSASKSTSQPFGGGLNPSQSFQVSTVKPTVLTEKGYDKYLNEQLSPKLDTEFKTQLGRDYLGGKKQPSKVVRGVQEQFLPFSGKDLRVGDFDPDLEGIGAPILPSNRNLGTTDGIQKSSDRAASEALKAYEQAQGKKAADTMKNIDSIKEEAIQINKQGGIGDSFMSGVASFNKGIYKIPRYLYDIASAPQNYLAEALDMPELAAEYDDLLKTTGDYSPLTILDKLGDISARDEEYFQNKVQKYNDGIVESISKGNFSDAGAQIANSIAQSIPSMVGMAITSGASNASKLGYIQKTLANALPFASNQNEVLRNEDVPDYIRPISAGLNALSEVIFDQSFGTQAAIDNLVKIYNKSGREAAEEAGKEIAKGYLGRAMSVVGGVKPVAKGSLEEMATTFSQNLVNKYTVDPNQDLMAGVLDAGIVGGVMTGTVAIGGKALLGRYNKKQKEELEKLSQQRSDIVDDLDKPELPIEVKSTLQDNLELVDAKIEVLTNDSEAEVQNLPDDIKQEVISKQQELAKLEEQSLSDGITETTKSIINEKIKALEADINDTIDKSKPKDDTARINEINAVIERNNTELAKTDLDADTRETIEIQNEQLKEELTKLNQDAVKEGNIQQGGEQQREGVVSQEQGQQEDRVNQEEPISQAETTPSSGNSTIESGQEQVISTQSNNINDTTRQGETTKVNGTVTESLPVGETVETADTTAIQEDVISNSTFWQDLTESDKRATRIKTIEDRLSKFKSSRSNLSIAQDPKEQAKYMRDLTELAILKIANGTVKTAKAFSDMVKGYGFTQDNIDKAYYAAVESVKKYSETNPDQLSINEREGELVVNFQQPKEAQATTKVGVGKVKELTEGGIKGKITITNKQALKSQIQTLNRGIREGIKQQKEKGNKEANVLSEAKKKVSDWIESFKQTDYFKGKAIPNSVVARLASRALAVKNVNQLYRLTEYMEKVFDNVEFFNSVEKVNSLKTKVKALSKKIKKRKASKELAESLNEITLIDPTYLSLEDVKLYESVLDNASKLFTSPVADLYDGIATRLEESSAKAKEQYQALKEIRINANKLTDSYKKAKIKSLIGQLEDAGVPKEVLDTITKDKSLDEVIQDLGKQLEADLDSAGNPSKVKPTQREILSDVYEYLREEAQSNLEDYKDSLTKQEFDLLDSLLSLGADELSDTNLFQAVASLRNLSTNGSVEGLGKIAARAQLINNLKDKTKVNNFNEGFRQSSKIGRMLRSNFTSGTTYLRSLLRNEKYAGKVLGLLGISQFQESSAKAFRKIEATVKEVEDLFKKYKTLADPYKISEITVLADLVSYREGWTDEEIQENFQKQKDQLKQTIEGEEAQSKLDDEYAEANKDSIKDLKDIYESVKDLTLEEAQKRLNNLDGGAKELYDLVRAKFDEIKEQAMFVSKQFGGNSFEKGWVNYIPRGFKNLGSNDIEKIRNIEEAKDGFFGSTLKEAASAEASGLKSRVGGMRKGYVRDYNFVTNFFRTYNELVYNIETKADINYMLEALSSEDIQSNTKARGQYLRGLTDLMLRKINNDKTAALFGSSENLYRKLINAYSDLAVAQALGGIGQIVKQGVPVIADTLVRTIDTPFLMFKVINDYATNRKKVQDFMKVTSVSMRNQSNAVLPTFNPNKIKNIIRRTVGLKGVELERLTDNLSKISMTSLTLGDQESANISWLTFYSKYMLEEDGVTEIDYDSKPNSDAVAYANLMVNTLANESDSSLKSEITRTQTFKSVFMLMSFAINSMEDLASNIARLRHSQTYNKKDLASITKNISANLVQVASFHYIAAIVRDLAIQGYGKISEIIFDLGGDDEEEKKLYEDTIAYTVKEAREMNQIRSKVFWLDDFLFRGLGKAIVGDAFDDVTTSVGNYLGIISDEEKFKLDDKKPYQKSEFENTAKLFGILGIPVQNAVSIYKIASDIISEDADNEQFLKNRFAQESASGTGIFIPEEDKNKKLDDELKMVALTNLTVGMLNFIIPFQEVGGINRRLTSLNRKVREVKFGKKQDKEENLKLLKSLSTFKIGDRDIVLTPEQLDFALKTREDLYNKYYQEDKAFYVRNKISEKDFEKEIGSNLNKATRDAVLMKYAEKDLADKSKIDFETKKKELDFIVEKFIESKTK